MEVEKRGREIVINLTRKEVFDLQTGRTIGDRPGVTMSDAKIEIVPLGAIEPDDSLKDRWAIDRLEKATKAPLNGILFSNGDLQIIVPAIKLSDVRLTNAKLTKESIKTPITNARNDLINVIPENGVRLNFGGSLKVVNIPDFFA